MASLQSNSTFSFKHHLTGEARPACRAILPFHSNIIQTPLFEHHSTGELARHAWHGSLYIVRTSTIAKNRHLNIVLRAELYLRTGNCKLNFKNLNCCMEIWEWTSHYSTCKLKFEKSKLSCETFERKKCAFLVKNQKNCL